MRVKLAKFWHDLHSSYWFIPAVMALAAMALALGLTEFDQTIKQYWPQEKWLLANRPEGARAILATIAGSMITVAGVTFSVTISAVAYATAQFGPRLLTNFMQDRGNQITLGTFIATFIYCLMVLRTVQSAGHITAGAELAQAHVPQLALTVALGLALASVAVLIYFIHHVPASIHVSKVAARIGHELNTQIDRIYATRSQPKPQPAPDQELLAERLKFATPVRADQNGYVQHLDWGKLCEVAEEQDIMLFIERHPGDFVIEKQPLLYLWPPIKAEQKITEPLQDSYALGPQRTQAQDLMFLTRELVEIANRALSPGINDPFTAINCMNWLGSMLAKLATKEQPTAYYYDEKGELRLISRPEDFELIAGFVFDALRPYVKQHRSTALQLLRMIAMIAPLITKPEQQAFLLLHTRQLYQGCREQALTQQADIEAVEQYYEEVVDIIVQSDLRKPMWQTT